jgi:hypothetical protein
LPMPNIERLERAKNKKVWIGTYLRRSQHFVAALRILSAPRYEYGLSVGRKFHRPLWKEATFCTKCCAYPAMDWAQLNRLYVSVLRSIYTGRHI